MLEAAKTPNESNQNEKKNNNQLSRTVRPVGGQESTQEIEKDILFVSQSDGQNESAKSGTNLQRKTIRVISLQRNLKDTNDNGISL